MSSYLTFDLRYDPDIQCIQRHNDTMFMPVSQYQVSTKKETEVLWFFLQ